MLTTSNTKKSLSSFMRKQSAYIFLFVISFFIVIHAQSSFFSFFAKAQRVHTEAMEIKKDTAELALLRDENKTLKEALGRSTGAPGVLAHVITPPNRSLYDTMMIDAGSAEHIAVGHTVYGLSDVALGKVSEVHEHMSLVSLFSTSGVETPGSVVGSGISLTLIGRGGGEYEVRMPRDIPFAVGDVIAEQSSGAKILATVEKVTGDARDPFITIRAKVPLNLQSLPWVLIK